MIFSTPAVIEATQKRDRESGKEKNKYFALEEKKCAGLPGQRPH